MPNPLELANVVEVIADGVGTVLKGSDASLALFEDGAGKGLAGIIPKVGIAAEGEPALAGAIPTVGKAFDAEQALTLRLMDMKPQAPAGDFIRAALATNDPQIIGAVHGTFKLPIEARSLLDAGDFRQMTGWLQEGGSANLAQVRSTLDAVKELGSAVPRDATTSEILNRVAQSGVVGHNPWVGDTLHLGGV